MTTAQDQQSRAELLPCPFCGGKPHVRPSQDADGCFWAWVQCGQCGARTQGNWVSSCTGACPIFYEGVREEWNRRAPAEQAARALRAGVEPVYQVEVRGRLQDPTPLAAAFDLPDGKHGLFTAAQVLAMLDAGISGNKLPPGWQAVPVEQAEVICGPGNCWGGAAYDAYRASLAAAPRPPAAQSNTGESRISPTPAAQKRYRLLERGIDTIQVDDEFLRDDAVAWQADPQGIFVGMLYMSNVLRPARRAIESAP